MSAALEKMVGDCQKPDLARALVAILRNEAQWILQNGMCPRSFGTSKR